jgi:transcriptional regulator with XRE-family HTH domain
MAGHKPFSELIARMSPEAREEIKRGTAQILAEMEMAELRDALKIRQVELAGKLHTTQAAISRLEKAPQHTKISTLQKYVEGLGGQIEIRAVFTDRIVKLTHLATKIAKPKRAGFTLRTKTKASRIVRLSRKARQTRKAPALTGR